MKTYTICGSMRFDKEKLMKRLLAFIFVLTSILTIAGCSGENMEITNTPANSLTLGKLEVPRDKERIGNQIPQWVSNADWNKSLYAVSSSDIEDFDTYAKLNFPNYCDAGWTQEQSDSVYLGQGIELFVLDDIASVNRIIYYPVILNGVIVGGYQVIEQLDSQQFTMTASPFLADELNVIMELTNKDTPLMLGYNNDNMIGIIGETYYVLDIDHMEHKDVVVNKIPVIEFDTCINVMEALCAERTANVDDWTMFDR